MVQFAFDLRSRDTAEPQIRPTSAFELLRVRSISNCRNPSRPFCTASRIELTLKRDRFLFRPFELPSRAAEFLDGVVRSQIDRLTPWSASEAAFGWSKPSEAGSDRIAVTVAATVRTLVAPYVQAVAELGARSIAVFTTSARSRSRLLTHQGDGGKNSQDFLTLSKFAKSSSAHSWLWRPRCGCSCGLWRLVGIGLNAQQDELAHRIASLRASAGASSSGTLGSLALLNTRLRIAKTLGHRVS